MLHVEDVGLGVLVFVSVAVPPAHITGAVNDAVVADDVI
jgi:hypothetical protein